MSVYRMDKLWDTAINEPQLHTTNKPHTHTTINRDKEINIKSQPYCLTPFINGQMEKQAN